ncbi:hypothetical protein [Lacipirellula sp.]|uniref:hypothetical protein n=1 Tax=Lacipirellula sp. TaxID=2691419 RepID=UPI003D0A03DC
MRRFTIATCLVLVTLCCLWSVSTSAMAPGKETAEADRFAGKLVLVYFKGRDDDLAYTLEKVRVSDLAGEKMLEGLHADTGEDGDWMKGRKAVVMLSAVESLTLYDGVDDYKKAIGPYGDDAL